MKQYHEAYGYDLKAALSKYVLAEMDGGEKEKALLHSLHKGNLQAVGLQQGGGLTKMYIEANPQYKTITFYDSSLKRVPKEGLAPYLRQDSNVKQEQKVTVNQEQKTAKEPDDTRQGRSQTRASGR